MSAGLVIDALSAGYGGVPVLRGVTLILRPGEAAALFGANGSGKSTLLKAINGLLPYDGEIRFGDRSLRGLATERIASLGIAHVPQGRGTFVGFTVEQNLRLGGSLLPGRDLAGAFERVYALIPELRDRRRQIAGTLSGGEQQMLALARALMMRPKLLLLDEPSHGLAPKIVRRFFATLAQLSRAANMSLLLVEQNPAIADDIADTAHLLEHGSITLTGKPGDPAFAARLWQSYLTV